MKLVYLWFALPAVFLFALLGAVMQTPDFITTNFTLVWFFMVLVVIVAALGILWSGLQAGAAHEKSEPHGPAETSHD